MAVHVVTTIQTVKMREEYIPAQKKNKPDGSTSGNSPIVLHRIGPPRLFDQNHHCLLTFSYYNATIIYPSRPVKTHTFSWGSGLLCQEFGFHIQSPVDCALG